MSDLRTLYQEVILDHSRHPRNFGRCKPSNREAHGHNPLCGDQITVYAQIEDGIVRDISFEGRGCAISTASASLMTDMMKGLPEAEARKLFETFHAMVTGEIAPEEMDSLEKLAVLGGVRDYPMRVKCATLAWHTLTAALDRKDDPVVTE